MDASEVIGLLALSPHPEGGWFRETWRGPAPAGGRGSGTAIYYLLAEGERSHWHRIDAAEVWHFYAGDPLELTFSADGVSVDRRRLGGALSDRTQPQHVVPAHTWQSARPLGRWALVGCTVSPAFEPGGFELAPADWEPGH
jgi:predicted cupin superfamily sugar epimerase